MKKILIIEDEENIRELIAYNLTAEGYACVSAGNGTDGLDMARVEAPDLILLDIMLPGMDGYEILKALRREGADIPIIMLTAKSDETDKVTGLDYGADDYITKPFGVRELIARINALLRRVGRMPAMSDEALGLDDDGIIRVGELVIDIPGREVRIGGRDVQLTFKEFELLQTLAKNRGTVLTRDQLLDSIWGYDYYGETRTVDVHVRYLRKKLGGDENRYISTVRGLGYKMVVN
jgi:two-component system alkaline phosphatase synthesis response regulator PhoP